VETCSHCGGDLPDNATFCPSCGRRTDLPAPEPREEPIDVQHTDPHYFGLGSPVFVFGVMLVLLVVGIVLVVLGPLAVGLVSIILAACLLPTFLAGARRWPETQLARAGVSTAGRVRDEADVAAESISTWSKTGRDVVRLRKEQFRLRRERDAKIRELGVSVFEEDGRADELKAAAKDLDNRRLRNEREQQRAIATARRGSRKRRAAVVATEVIQPERENAEKR
jgi:zinc-ribbon domain